MENSFLISSLHEKSFILDIDGVLWAGDHPADNSIPSVELLRNNSKGICLLTNDAVSSRLSRIEELNRAGFTFSSDEIFTASFLAAEYVKLRGKPKTLILGGGYGLDEFKDIQLTRISPAIVVVLDFFDYYERALLDAAFKAIINGAELIAAQKNKYWRCAGENILDVGFWVAGLEYCCSSNTKIIGKPSAFSYQTCLRYLKSKPSDTVMISDDSLTDLRGAKELGIKTIHISRDYKQLIINPVDNVDVGSPSLALVVNNINFVE